MSQAALNQALAPSETALDVIEENLSGALRPIVTTKFGPESAVLLHMLTRIQPDIPVVWVDTGYNTRSTLLFAEHLTQQLLLNLSVWRPDETHVYRQAPSLDDPDHAAFSEQVKLEPFRRALAEHRPDVWFSALRREQTEFRSQLPVVLESGRGYRKVHPLLDWTAYDIQEYLATYDLPSEENYYDPTKGEPKRECGLHLAF